MIAALFDRRFPRTADAKRYRCYPERKPGRHYFPPFVENSDLGGGAQRCECGMVLIDRSLGGGRVVEIGATP